MPASINSRRAARRSLTLFLDILRGALGAVGRTMHATQIQPLDQLGRDLMDTDRPSPRPVGEWRDWARGPRAGTVVR